MPNLHTDLLLAILQYLGLSEGTFQMFKSCIINNVQIIRFAAKSPGPVMI